MANQETGVYTVVAYVGPSERHLQSQGRWYVGPPRRRMLASSCPQDAACFAIQDLSGKISVGGERGVCFPTDVTGWGSSKSDPEIC